MEASAACQTYIYDIVNLHHKRQIVGCQKTTQQGLDTCNEHVNNFRLVAVYGFIDRLFLIHFTNRSSF